MSNPRVRLDALDGARVLRSVAHMCVELARRGHTYAILPAEVLP